MDYKCRYCCMDKLIQTNPNEWDIEELMWQTNDEKEMIKHLRSRLHIKNKQIFIENEELKKKMEITREDCVKKYIEERLVVKYDNGEGLFPNGTKFTDIYHLFTDWINHNKYFINKHEFNDYINELHNQIRQLISDCYKSHTGKKLLFKKKDMNNIYRHLDFNIPN